MHVALEEVRHHPHEPLAVQFEQVFAVSEHESTLDSARAGARSRHAQARAKRIATDETVPSMNRDHR